jgi:translation initiation factor IF-2
MKKKEYYRDLNKNTTSMPKSNTQSNIVTRPPVVVIMVHVDHGKSTLLDYIRKSNIVDGEAGSITQHISAYKVSHKSEAGEDRSITFLDTPGHEAFSKMRQRGAAAADMAILIVSAEDGVKAQTLEAYNTIIESNTPYIVAINKVDKPNANIEKTKMELAEKGIYLEGMGGDIPSVQISAKAGTGVSELLDMILLVADLTVFTGDTTLPATGIVIEAHREPKRGISASCIIKNGTLTSGMFVACGSAIVTTRIMENFLGKPIKEASLSEPIRLTGFESMPDIGSTFFSFENKKEAEEYVKEILNNPPPVVKEKENNINATTKIIPLIIKTDVMGTNEALAKEISKLNTPEIAFKIVSRGTGGISETDIKMASINTESISVGFNTKMDREAININESLKVEVQTFDIIYKLIEWLAEAIQTRRPKKETLEITGSLKVLKTFGGTKDKQIVGGKVTTGRVADGGTVRIMRRDFEIGNGKIVGLQLNKMKVKEVLEATDCGIQIESKTTIAPGDILEAFIISII